MRWSPAAKLLEPFLPSVDTSDIPFTCADAVALKLHFEELKMNCHLCGKNCVSRLEGRRTVLSGKVLFLCDACASDGHSSNDKPAVNESDGAESVVPQAA